MQNKGILNVIINEWNSAINGDLITESCDSSTLNVLLDVSQYVKMFSHSCETSVLSSVDVLCLFHVID